MSDQRVYIDYARDMAEALRDIRDFVQGYTLERFVRDKKTVCAVIRGLEVLGEAAGKIPAPVRAGFPEIPWTEMVGMRNRLIHEYFGVDLEIIWQTVCDDLPPLHAAVDRLVTSLADSSVPDV
jgi:uncharacterized protein with HEPN domain